MAQEVAQQSPGTCGFQLDRSTAFLPLETPGAWRYARWWIPGLPVRRLQKGRKKKNKNGEILDNGIFSYVSLFRMSASEGLWEEFSSRVIC